MLTFRFLPVARTAELVSWAGARRYGLDFWDALIGDREAVSAEYRGRGLGRYVNALMAAHTFCHLDATHLYQFVSVDDLPSRRMVEAIGLRCDPTTVAAAITLDGTRFTR